VSGLRIDKWLWAARFFKTRSLAIAALGGGKIKRNGAPTKPAHEVKVGDRLAIINGDCRWEIVVMALSEKRGPASEAKLLYEETAESIAARETEQLSRKLTRDPAAERHGRPTKRERRKLDTIF